LAEIVEALDFTRFSFRPTQRWQKQTREDGDDGNDNQKFDKGECAMGLKIVLA
jgi:hypothetical protein